MNMSDSSEDEDLSRFKESIDSSFTKLIDQSRSKQQIDTTKEDVVKKKSERYLDVASHYNDVKVPEDMQKKIGAKISAIISKKVEYVDIDRNAKKRKIKGGVKLFKGSEGFLSCEDLKDTYTELHNAVAKKIERTKRKIDDVVDFNVEDKINSVVLSGEYILSKEETNCWKSRKKEKLYKYKKNKNSKVLTAIE